MKVKSCVWRWCAVLLSIVFLGTVLQAQSVHGTLAGVVSDTTGAVIAGAKVDIVNMSTAAAYNTKTTSVGVFRFEDVALGEYTITVTSPGFKTALTKGVLVQIGTVSSITITLQTGAASEQVTVNSEGPTIETDSSDIGGVISEKQIVDLPLALGGVGAMRANEAFIFCNLQPRVPEPPTATTASSFRRLPAARTTATKC